MSTGDIKNCTSNTLLIGAGPIGVEVAAALKACGDNYIHLEAGALGETISRWPPHTLFFSSPEWIAICGIPIHSHDQRRITGEEYLAYLRQVVESLSLSIRFYNRVTKIERTGDSGEHRYCVHATAAQTEQRYYCRNIVLAIGDMERPRELGLPGEELHTVSHRLQDPHRYFQQDVLIVGGRNSACEAALRCWRVGARVAMSYRRSALPKRGILARLKLEIDLLMKKGQMILYAPTVPRRFGNGWAELVHPEGSESHRVAADFVFLATGFEPDYTLYRSLGVALHGAAHAPRVDSRTQESESPGVYVAGTATAGSQNHYTVFITTCHDHASKIAKAITGRDYTRVGNTDARNFLLSQYDLE